MTACACSQTQIPPSKSPDHVSSEIVPGYTSHLHQTEVLLDVHCRSCTSSTVERKAGPIAFSKTVV